MAEGKTYWLCLDARWLQREGVTEAREEVGHAAVTVLIALMGQAKLENDPGRVVTGYRALAREAFLDGPDEARQVIAACVSAGLLDDLEEHEDGKRFACRLSGWQADQSKGRDAYRKAAKRADIDGQPPDTPGQGRTCPVPVRESTAQHSTEEPHRAAATTGRPRFRKRPIPDDRLHASLTVFDAFQQRAGTQARPYTTDGRLSEGLSRIVGAFTDDDRWTVDIATRAIDAAFAAPYWTGIPTPAVVFGEKVRDRYLEQALRPQLQAVPTSPGGVDPARLSAADFGARQAELRAEEDVLRAHFDRLAEQELAT